MDTRVKRQLSGKRLADIAKSRLRLSGPSARGTHNQNRGKTFAIGATRRKHGPTLSEWIEIVSSNKLPHIVHHTRAVRA